MNKILNLTQHLASAAQIKGGVIEPSNKQEVQELLNFKALPSREEVNKRAEKLAHVVVKNNCNTAMIGGAPFLMAPLERALRDIGTSWLYAFSYRESVEEIIDGETIKRSVFCHKGWV